MGGCGIAGISDRGDDVSPVDLLPHRHIDRAAMAVKGGQAAAVVDDHLQPIAGGAVFHLGDHAALRRMDGAPHQSAVAARVIIAVVELGAAAPKGVVAGAEPAGNAKITLLDGAEQSAVARIGRIGAVVRGHPGVGLVHGGPVGRIGGVVFALLGLPVRFRLINGRVLGADTGRQLSLLGLQRLLLGQQLLQLGVQFLLLLFQGAFLFRQQLKQLGVRLRNAGKGGGGGEQFVKAVHRQQGGQNAGGVGELHGPQPLLKQRVGVRNLLRLAVHLLLLCSHRRLRVLDVPQHEGDLLAQHGALLLQRRLFGLGVLHRAVQLRELLFDLFQLLLQVGDIPAAVGGAHRRGRADRQGQREQGRHPPPPTLRHTITP